MVKSTASQMSKMKTMLVKANELVGMDEETIENMNNLVKILLMKFTKPVEEPNKSPSVFSQDDSIFSEPSFLAEVDAIVQEHLDKCKFKRTQAQCTTQQNINPTSSQLVPYKHVANEPCQSVPIAFEDPTVHIETCNVEETITNVLVSVNQINPEDATAPSDEEHHEDEKAAELKNDAVAEKPKEG